MKFSTEHINDFSYLIARSETDQNQYATLCFCTFFTLSYFYFPGLDSIVIWSAVLKFEPYVQPACKNPKPSNIKATTLQSRAMDI